MLKDPLWVQADANEPLPLAAHNHLIQVGKCMILQSDKKYLLLAVVLHSLINMLTLRICS